MPVWAIVLVAAGAALAVGLVVGAGYIFYQIYKAYVDMGDM